MAVKALRSKDLRAFHKSVADVILDLANKQGVKTRMPDGRHVFLYPPDGTSRPFKVSASRPALATLRFIEEQFCKPNHLEMP
jgi:hypothetical protein